MTTVIRLYATNGIPTTGHDRSQGGGHRRRPQLIPTAAAAGSASAIPRTFQSSMLVADQIAEPTTTAETTTAASIHHLNRRVIGPHARSKAQTEPLPIFEPGAIGPLLWTG